MVFAFNFIASNNNQMCGVNIRHEFLQALLKKVDHFKEFKIQPLMRKLQIENSQRRTKHTRRRI
jgi:activator of HSP90 ATPase